MASPFLFMSHIDTHIRNEIISSDWYSADLSVLIALSGGADSIFLAEVLRKIPLKKIGIAHFNHQLRGQESKDDELFCRKYANAHSLQYYTISSDIGLYADNNKRSVEEEGRIQRYRWFEELSNEFSYDIIFTGHHFDDNLETLLLNLFSGSGFKGMSGISPRLNNIVRPLLYISKKSIIHFLDSNHISWRYDKSNENMQFQRNYFRNLIGQQDNLDSLKEFSTLALSFIKSNHSLNRLIANDVNYLIKQQITCHNNSKITLELGGLKKYFSPVLKELFDICFKKASGAQQGLKIDDFKSIILLINGHIKSNKISLPKKIKVYKERQSLVFLKEPYFEWQESEVKELIENDYFKIFYRTIVTEKEQIITQKNNTLLVESIVGIQIRHWKKHDTMIPFGQSQAKKISRVLQDQKIDLHLREKYPVLEYRGDIIWIPGVRPSENTRLKTSNIQRKEIFEISFTLKRILNADNDC